MLRACRHTLKPGGRIAFYTIQPHPGLDPRRRRRANRLGPPSVAVPTSYRSLLHSAGFTEIEAFDETGEYRETLQRWIDAMTRYEDGLRASMGEVEFEERVAKRSQTLAGVDAGLLSRFRYTAARAPGAVPRPGGR